MGDDDEWEIGPDGQPRRKAGFWRSLGRGLAESGYGTGIGLTRLLGLDRAAESLEGSREQARAFYGDPEGAAGVAGSLIGNIAGAGAQFAVPGMAAGRLAGALGLASKAPRVAAVLAPASRAGQFGRDVALNLPLNAAIAQDDESSIAGALEAVAGGPLPGTSSKLGRTLYEMAGDVAGEQLLRGGAKVLGKAARATGVDEVARRAGQSLRDTFADEAGKVGAWHGSGKRFDRFDSSKIGTGEGVQVYGHGLYFAEEPDVARQYRAALAPGKTPGVVTRNGEPVEAELLRTISGFDKPLEGQDVLDIAEAFYLNRAADFDRERGEAVRSWEKLRNNGGIIDDAVQLDHDMRVSALESMAETQRRYAAEVMQVDPEGLRFEPGSHDPGALYEVELDVDPDADLFDWDAPFSKQPPKVRAALQRVFEEHGILPPGGRFGVDYNGEKLHRILATDLARAAGGSHEQEGAAAAAKVLSEAGIPGVRYLDQQSRLRGTGTRNYVIFDDALVAIRNREGYGGAQILGGMAAGGALGGAAGSQVGDSADERLRNTLVGAGTGMIAGAAGGGRLARQLDGVRPRGAVDPRAGAVGGRRSRFGERLYSRVERAIEGAPFAKGTGQQWRAVLSKGTPKGEREWLGIDKILEENADRVMTREEVEAIARHNKIEIGEKFQGEYDQEAAERAQANADYERSQLHDRLERVAGIQTDKILDVVEQSAHDDGAIDRALRMLPQDLSEREWGQWRDRFARYRDRVRAANNIHDTDQARFGEYVRPGEHSNYREIVLTLDSAKGEPFQYFPHWGTTNNPIAHVRLTDRELPGGGKALYVEEIQSDWHQQGRQHGYDREAKTAAMGDAIEQDAALDRQIAALEDRALELFQQASGDELVDPAIARSAVRNLGDPITRNPQHAVLEEQALAKRERGEPLTPSEEFRITTAELARLNRQRHGTRRGVDDARRAAARAVPDAPFKQTGEWTELALKRILDEAAEGGYDRVVLPTGKSVADNFNLSQQTSGIRLSQEVGDRGRIDIEAADEEGVYQHLTTVDAEELDDYVGREIAEKFRAGEQHTFEGDDLSVGGHGMRAYYDQIVPRTLRDYAKKLGVAIDLEPVPEAASEQLHQLLAEQASNHEALRALQSATVPGEGGVPQWSVANTPEIRERIARDRHLASVIEKLRGSNLLAGGPSFRVTPELREKVRAGQRLMGLGLAGAGAGARLSRYRTPEEEREERAALSRVMQ